MKGQFGPNGALYSGWETRRHNPLPYDWSVHIPLETSIFLLRYLSSGASCSWVQLGRYQDLTSTLQLLMVCSLSSLSIAINCVHSPPGNEAPEASVYALYDAEPKDPVNDDPRV
jgi:allantoicase